MDNTERPIMEGVQCPSSQPPLHLEADEIQASQFASVNLEQSKHKEEDSTVHFDYARKKIINTNDPRGKSDIIPESGDPRADSKGQQSIFSQCDATNLNDPEENPVMFPQYGGPDQVPRADPMGSKVPQFVVWDNEDNVGYTASFEEKQKTKISDAMSRRRLFFQGSARLIKKSKSVHTGRFPLLDENGLAERARPITTANEEHAYGGGKRLKVKPRGSNGKDVSQSENASSASTAESETPLRGKTKVAQVWDFIKKANPFKGKLDHNVTLRMR